MDELNRRFRRSPLNLEWSADGALADAGLLVHSFDGWEDHGEPWLPSTAGPGATGMSASYVFKDQEGGCRGKPCVLPLFGVGDGKIAGMIFRPLATKLLCGKSGDSGGVCGTRCSRRSTNEVWDERLDKTCSWLPEDFGVQLRRVTTHQVKYTYLWYNEIIVDSKAWRADGPLVVEAIFGNKEIHRGFIDKFPHLAASHPFMVFDPMNWHSPLSLAH